MTAWTSKVWMSCRHLIWVIDRWNSGKIDRLWRISQAKTSSNSRNISNRTMSCSRNQKQMTIIEQPSRKIKKLLNLNKFDRVAINMAADMRTTFRISSTYKCMKRRRYWQTFHQVVLCCEEKSFYHYRTTTPHHHQWHRCQRSASTAILCRPEGPRKGHTIGLRRDIA